MPYNYYNAMNPYVQNGYMPYIQNTQRPQEQYQVNQPTQPMQYIRQMGLQGRIVDNIDVVKTIEIPLDFTTSYFPLTDGSAIVTKQLQQDGKSKTIVYVPMEEEKQADIKYITESDLKAQLSELNPKDIKDIKEEIKNLKKRIRELTDDIEDKKGE